MTPPRNNEGTRQLLLDEGVSAFLQNGYHGTGLKQVLDRVKVPKGSFYNYFASKEDFGAQAIEHYSQCMGQKLRAALGSNDNALLALRGLLQGLMEDFEATDFTGGCLVANLGGELEHNDVCRPALARALDQWRAGISAALATAQQQGQVRTDVPAAELGDMLVDSWEGAVIRMKINRTLSPLEDCLRRHLDGYFLPRK